MGAFSVVGLLLAACGVPADDSPVRVDVPSDLFDVGFSPTEPPDANEPNVTLHPIYFFRDGFLVNIQRALPSPVFLEVPMNNLLEGPNSRDAADGLETSIPAGTEVEVSQITGNIVKLDLNDAFFEVEGEALQRATAQLVFTGYGLVRDAQGVIFYRDGEPAFLPKGDGSIAEVAEGENPPPHTLEDFSGLVAPPLEPETEETSPLPEVTNE